MSGYVSLHNHTDFSLLRSSSRIGDLVARAAELEMPALAITDEGNLFGALHFVKACRNHGVQPIIGADFFLAAESRHNKTSADSGLRAARLVLLACSDRGYRNLIQLTSAAYTEGFYYRPRIDDELLERHHEDLICLTGSVSGDIPRRILFNQREEAERRVHYYRDLFGRDKVFFELNSQGIPDQQSLNESLHEMSGRLGVPCLVANESYYVRREDANAHDTLLCIGGNKRKADESRFRFSTDEFFLKSEAEIRDRFASDPEAIENTLRVAELCAFDMDLPGPKLPDYEIPAEFASPDDYLRHLGREGLKERYSTITQEMKDRLEYELDTIINMGFTGYLLITWDFIAFARSRGIPVGPGRGSGAGSIVAYSLKITDIDPLKYGLLFERFLNPDRVSMPDFDIDFCYERRSEVIDYVIEKYGSDRVGQIITFGTMKARAVIRDVARALDVPLGETDAIAKLVPRDPKITLSRAIEEVPDLKAVSERGSLYADLIDTSLRLEGLHRHASTHAAGIVIGREELTRYVPLYRDPRTEAISTQYTMDQLEDCGLVKMDFLGLKTLTLVENTRELLKSRGVEIDLDRLPEDDAATFEMLSAGHSKCVFQFEGAGMTAVLKRAKPSRIEDLIALNSLFRPGPMENIDQFVDSKNGRMPIQYPLPQLERVLRETYGVIVYQEQVMEIVRVVAGFSLGQADILRRAMGKKKVEEMARMKVSYLEGAHQLGINKKDAERIFSLLEPFAGYGFNKSHAAAYSVLAYKTAYLKANHPVEFMAANLTNEINDSDKFSEYMAECRSMGIEVTPPDVNLSRKHFSVNEDKIVYGLVGIKNVGEGAVNELERERAANGPFESFIDFAERVDTRLINRKVTEVFVQSGLFDSLGEDRAVLHANLDRVIEYSANRRESRLTGQVSLFEGTDEISFEYLPPPADPEFDPLTRERELLGFYFSGHPLDAHREIWQNSTTLDLRRAGSANTDRVQRVLGLLKGLRIVHTKKGLPMAVGSIEDFNGSLEVVVFSEAFEKHRELLQDESIVGLEGKIDTSRDRIQMIVDTVYSPEEIPLKDTGEVHIRIQDHSASEEELYHLRAFLYDRPGGCNVYLHFNGNGDSREITVRASDQLTVSSKPDTLKEIQSHPQVIEVWKV